VQTFQKLALNLVRNPKTQFPKLIEEDKTGLYAHLDQVEDEYHATGFDEVLKVDDWRDIKRVRDHFPQVDGSVLELEPSLARAA